MEEKSEETKTHYIAKMIQMKLFAYIFVWLI